MKRGREETSTKGRPGGLTQATPSASSIISSLTIEELMRYCEVPDNISLRLVDRPDESTLIVEHNSMFLPRSISQPGYNFPFKPWSNNFYTLPGLRRPYTPQHDSHLNRLLCVEPFVPA